MAGRVAAVSAIICASAIACSGGSSKPPALQPPPPPPQGGVFVSLSLALSGRGAVRSSDGLVDCSVDCTISVAKGTTVVLHPVPAAGAHFAGWSGACNGTADCTLSPSSDASASAAFTDDAPPPPPPPDECAGLLPTSLPAPAVATLPRSGCIGGTSDDGSGNFALGFTAGNGPTVPSWEFFQVQGTTAIMVGSGVSGGDEGPAWLESQPSGFTKYSSNETSGYRSITSVGRDGVVTSLMYLTRRDHARAVAAVDPSGGTAVVRWYGDASDNGLSTTYARFDKGGALEVPEVKIGSGQAPLVVGVALSGDVLVLAFDSPGRRYVSRWLTRAGAPLADWASIGDKLSAQSLQFLVDGGLALFEGGSDSFTARFADGNPQPGPLPAWLQARASGKYAAVRSGHGYASWGGTTLCGPNGVEVLAASGKSCGCFTDPAWSRDASVGRDGSLIIPMEGVPDANHCSYKLYPGALR